ncbi:GntR family transcriptional regulator [Streptomyces mashuensis]|uniref:GntR family transcriptional regulator n=1 Tax=Streptomyces mashuensis TaxID=33904 RepID=UPI00167DED37|nr:GntR family transcriptional regulator [Streptomyces mashuensis]
MVEFRIDRRSGVATYLQIVQQVKQALRLGLLTPGDKLPTAKEVVAATAINPNTVLKAYRELDREGLVEARPGLGTFVRRSLARPGAAAGSPLRVELGAWMERARAAGLDREDVAALVASVLEESYGSPEQTGDRPAGDRPLHDTAHATHDATHEAGHPAGAR